MTLVDHQTFHDIGGVAFLLLEAGWGAWFFMTVWRAFGPDHGVSPEDNERNPGDW